MSVSTIWNTVKTLYPNYIIFVKIGKFYKVYNQDAYIVSYKLKYRLRSENIGNIKYSCGFPDVALKKIRAKMEELKINYLILDRRNNYEEDEKYNNKNLNKYNKVLEEAKIYANNIIRLDKINEYFMENINKEEIRKVLIQLEKEIDERRKI